MVSGETGSSRASSFGITKTQLVFRVKLPDAVKWDCLSDSHMHIFVTNFKVGCVGARFEQCKPQMMLLEAKANRLQVMLSCLQNVSEPTSLNFTFAVMIQFNLSGAKANGSQVMTSC